MYLSQYDTQFQHRNFQPVRCLESHSILGNNSWTLLGGVHEHDEDMDTGNHCFFHCRLFPKLIGVASHSRVWY